MSSEVHPFYCLQANGRGLLVGPCTHSVCDCLICIHMYAYVMLHQICTNTFIYLFILLFEVLKNDFFSEMM